MGYQLLLIFVGGGVGSVLRFLIGKFSIQHYTANFPLATFISNTISCLLIGLIVYVYLARSMPLSKSLTFLLVTGFCGGLSTFSTFSFETFELLKQGMVGMAILNVLLSILVGLAAIFILYKSAL